MRILRNSQARSVGGVAFGPGGRTLVAGGSGGYDVWDLAASTTSFTPSHAVKYLYGCVCEPLGRWAYVSDYRGKFRLLSLDGVPTRPLPGSPYQRHVRSFDLTPDGRRLVLSRGGGGNNRVECWNIKSDSFAAAWSLRDGKNIDPDDVYLLNESAWTVNAVAVAPGGASIATAEERPQAGSLIVLRNGTDGQAFAELGLSETGFQCRIAFSPDGRAVYAWDNRGVERWDVAAGRRTNRILNPGRAYFAGMAVHPSGRQLVTVSGDGVARYWDPADLSLLQTFKLGCGKLHAVANSPDGSMVAAGGDKGCVILWDVGG